VFYKKFQALLEALPVLYADIWREEKAPFWKKNIPKWLYLHYQLS
jgi:hypothetical protein